MVAVGRRVDAHATHGISHDVRFRSCLRIHLSAFDLLQLSFKWKPYSFHQLEGKAVFAQNSDFVGVDLPPTGT